MALIKGDTGSRVTDEVVDAAAALGLMVEGGAEQGGIDVWPENEDAVRAFISMGTQWNVGMGGPVGLRYESLPVVLDLLGIEAGARRALFPALRVMEHAALEEFSRGR